MSEAGTTGTRTVRPATSVVRRAGTSLSVYSATRKPILSSASGRGGRATRQVRDEGMLLSFEDAGGAALPGEDFMFDV
jgi:hypothetical protein